MEKINKCDNNGKKFKIKRKKNTNNNNNYEKLQNLDYDETDSNIIQNYDLVENQKNSNENYLIDQSMMLIPPPLPSSTSSSLSSSARSSILSTISSSSAVTTTSSSTSFDEPLYSAVINSDNCSESFIKNYNITEENLNNNQNKMKKSKKQKHHKMTYVKKLTLKFEKLAHHSSDIKKNSKKFQCIENFHNNNNTNNNYDNICKCIHDTSHCSCYINENHLTNKISTTPTQLSSSSSAAVSLLSKNFQIENYYSPIIIENQKHNKKNSKNYKNINYKKFTNDKTIEIVEDIIKDTFNNKIPLSSLKKSSSSSSTSSSSTTSSSSSSDAYETCDMSDESEFKSKQQQKQHNDEEIIVQEDIDQQVNNVDNLLQVKCTIEEDEEKQQQQQQENDEKEEKEVLEQQKTFDIPGIFIENIGESSTDEPLTILRESDINVEAKYRQSDPNPKGNQDICDTKNKHAASRSISNYPLTSNDDETDDIYSSSSTQLLSSSKLSLVYESKEIPPIIEELIRTEETYIKNLKIGIHNYGKILNRTNKYLPKGLKGKKWIILGNIEQICEFHDVEFLPMLIRNQFNLKDLFDDFMKLIDENCFYSYVLYTMNKKRSIKLCEQYRQYFKSVQEELNDKLGINSFLVQPIQRLARYPLLLQQFIMTCFKTGNIKYKPIIESCCKVEKRVRNLLTTTNEAEEINDIEDCNDINIFHQGKFKKMNEFNVYDYTQRRSYRSKVFIFDKCLLYTEIRDKRLIYRGYYPCEYIGFISKLKSFTLYYHKQKYQECEFTPSDKQILDIWIDLIRDMICLFAEDEKRKLKEKYSNNKNNNNTNNTNNTTNINSNNCNGYRQCDIYRRPSSILLLGNSSRLSTDSGTGVSVFSNSSTSSTNSQEENSPRTTWYADTFDTL